MDKVFLVANEKTSNVRKEKGVSMVSLVITIVVMLILLGIAFISSNDSVENAGKGIFIRELALVQQAANESKLDNQVDGTSEEIKFRGFYKTRIKNPPISFVSFSDDEIYGYVIDLEYVHTEDADRGHDYKSFAVDIESNVVEFGVDDVYVCDKDGNVFYAKGWPTSEGTYYSSNEVEGLGPIFVSINKIIAADAKSAIIRVEVKKSSSGDLSLKVDDVDATKVAVSPDGSTETFETTVYENKTYRLVAVEEKDGLMGRTTSSVDVTELDVVTFTIMYEANGGTDAPAAHLKTENVIARLSTQIPKRTGYTFLGWNENPSATIATYRPGGEYVFDRDVTFFAIWNTGNVRTFDVTYNDNGGANGPLPQEDLSGDYVISSVIPQREGYGFLGWSEDARATTPDYLPGDTVTLTKNLTLYAIWSKGTYTVTVTVDPEGAGTVTGNGAKFDGVETYISTSANPGFIFKNWSVKSGGVNLQNSTSPTTSFIMPENNVEIVAKYDVGGLTVRYNANKGTGAPSEQSVKYGDTITITTARPTRSGYDFIGWALRADATEPTHHENQSYTVTESVTFYAIWKKYIPTYTVKFNLNGGYGNINGDIGKFADIEKVQGATVTIPVGGANEPYRKDYSFKGWALAPDSDEVVLRPGDGYSRDANLEIFAVWRDELPPTVSLSPKQEEGSPKVKIVATVEDEGGLAGYAWTTSSTEPTSWEVDGINGSELVVEKVVNQKGEHHFWVKDLAGNITTKSMTAYEIKFDANGGINAPETQYQLENTDLILTTEKPKRDKYSFLGWSTSVTPGNTDADVNFRAGARLNINADTVLRAVWGEAFFTLSTKTGVTQIDGANIIVTVTKSAYTGNITVSSADPEIATVTITDNTITIVPGTKIGDVEITVTEDNEGITETILVTVERGIRKLTLDKTSHSFIYGDPSEKIGFTYNGKTTGLSTITSNANIATASAAGKTLTITPGDYGTATITLVLAQDDQYLERTADVEVTITKKKIVVTPNSDQSKVYDGTALTPKLAYTFAGNVSTEEPGFNGDLTREIGKDVGKYEIQIGNLELKNNGDFKADNYILELSGTKVYFEITPKRILLPAAITPQEYDGTPKEGILEGEDYTRGGEYLKTEAGNYTAIATLKDTKNFVWDDTNTTTSRNIKWEITRYDLTSSDISVDTLANEVYTGSEITPIPVIKKGETELVNGNDFTLTYTDNINVGTATVTITGKGNYKGTLTRTFEITKATMRVQVAGYSSAFDNKAHSITVTPMWPSTGYTIYYSETELITANYDTAGSTTKPTYTNVGTTRVYYYIVAPNFADYSGSEEVKITAKDMSGNLTISGVVDKSYTGNPITQTITVKDNDQNRNLEEGRDYTVTYANNVNVGTATLTVTGKGNYGGTKTANFEILGDVITITKNTEALVTELDITITRTLTPGKLQYKIDNGSWTDYTGVFKITADCTIYAQSIDNGNVIGTNQLVITNICEHDFIPATCIDDSVCRHCGLVNEAKLGHEFTSETPEDVYLSKAATCFEKAIYFHKCIRCTAKGTTTYEYGEPLGHEFTSKTATNTYICTPATCLNKATYYYKCIRCATMGEETYEYGEPLGHDFTSKTQTTTYWKSDATCTEAKTYYYKCSMCEAKGENTYTVGSPLGHDFTVQVINGTYLARAASCIEPAYYYYKCSRCDAKGTETFPYGEAAGHTFGDYVVVTAANCMEVGSKRRTCTKCGTSEMAEIPKDTTNHIGTEIEVIEIEPTCTATGRKKFVCSECSGVIRYETIQATAHNYSEPTCLDEGVCSNCGATKPALGHDWSAPVPPRVCNRCGLREDAPLVEVAQAIYSETDNSLTFLKDTTTYLVGGIFTDANGVDKIATAVYTGIEEDTYTPATLQPWNAYASSIKSVVVEDEIAPVSTAYWFYGCTALTSVDVSKLNTSNVENMLNTFGFCSSLTSLDLSNFDTTNVKTLMYMFYDCNKLTSINGITNWNTNKVQILYHIFEKCSSIETLDLSGWNTASVLDMQGVFSGCTSLTSLNISNFDTSSVSAMSSMFKDCKELTTLNLNISDWETGNITAFSRVFYGCTKLTNLDLSKWNVSKANDMSYMFYGCKNLATINISGWNTAVCQNFYAMFYDCESLASIDANELEVDAATDIAYMFKGCYSLKKLDLSSWNTNKVESSEYMFNACRRLEEVTLGTGFEFVETTGRLPAPSNTYITGATGLWYRTRDGKSYAPADVPNNEAATYVAVYTAYSITYNLNGGTLTSGNPSSYSIYTETITLGTPTKTGYTFKGWTGSNGTTAQTTVKIPKGSTGARTYTANWTANTYYVKYNVNGGSGTMANTTHTYGTGSALRTNAFTRTGYTFKGWATTAAGAVTYADKAAVSTLTTTNGGTVELFAVWEANNYTYNIVYNSSSGVSLGTSTVTKAYGTTNTISPVAKTGYTSPAAQSITWDSTTAKTITFTYTPTSYNITINCNGGSGVSSTSYNIETPTFTLGTPTRSGYYFSGWTGTNGTTAQETVTIAKGSYGAKSYTANWEPLKSIAEVAEVGDYVRYKDNQGVNLWRIFDIKDGIVYIIPANGPVGSVTLGYFDGYVNAIPRIESACDAYISDDLQIGTDAVRSMKEEDIYRVIGYTQPATTLRTAWYADYPGSGTVTYNGVKWTRYRSSSSQKFYEWDYAAYTATDELGTYAYPRGSNPVYLTIVTRPSLDISSYYHVVNPSIKVASLFSSAYGWLASKTMSEGDGWAANFYLKDVNSTDGITRRYTVDSAGDGGQRTRGVLPMVSLDSNIKEDRTGNGTSSKPWVLCRN